MHTICDFSTINGLAEKLLYESDRAAVLGVIPYKVIGAMDLKGQGNCVLLIDHYYCNLTIAAREAGFELFGQDVWLPKNRFPTLEETIEEKRWKAPAYRAQYCGFSKGQLHG